MEYNDNFMFSKKYQRRGKEIAVLYVSCMPVTKRAEVPLCPYCEQLLTFIRYKASNGKDTHRKCYALYEATLALHHTKEAAVKFYLDGKTHEYVVTCEGCPKETRLQCSQADIGERIRIGGWGQFGRRLLCPDCVQTMRRKLYRAVGFSK